MTRPQKTKTEGMVTVPKGSDVVADLLTRKATAIRLSLSTRILDRMASRGLIERVYVGGSVRFREVNIANIIENGI